MNCYLHPETPAAAFCRSCGRPLCQFCQRTADGTIFCQDHVPIPAGAYPPYTAPPPGAGPANPYTQGASAASPIGAVNVSPGLAFGLGWIPGVGAIYNGQYLKGLIHALVLGLLITLADSAPNGAQPLFGIMLAAFIFYMPFEAYHTAKKRQSGLAVDEWSSILPQPRYSSRAPIGPIVLIAVGVLYLLNSLNLIEFHQIARFWPIILIGVGAYMLYSRVTAPERIAPAQPFSNPGANPAGDYMGQRHE